MRWPSSLAAGSDQSFGPAASRRIGRGLPRPAGPYGVFVHARREAAGEGARSSRRVTPRWWAVRPGTLAAANPGRVTGMSGIKGSWRTLGRDSTKTRRVSSWCCRRSLRPVGAAGFDTSTRSTTGSCWRASVGIVGKRRCERITRWSTPKISSSPSWRPSVRVRTLTRASSKPSNMPGVSTCPSPMPPTGPRSTRSMPRRGGSTRSTSTRPPMSSGSAIATGRGSIPICRPSWRRPPSTTSSATRTTRLSGRAITSVWR